MNHDKLNDTFSLVVKNSLSLVEIVFITYIT